MTAAAETRPVRILIADDHDIFAEGLAVGLAGYPELAVVARAADGAEAVALAALLRPDVILMDVSMPTMDGITATREITERHKQTTVVVVSALTDPQTAGRARSAGAAAYLFKGCPIDDLIAAIHEAAPSSSLEARAA
jgi:DNA-binding NarL/FixJ family response regulator